METQPQIDLTTMSRRQRFYYRHKEDPAFIEKQKDQKKRYYLKNRDMIKEKNLKRYYDKKTLLTA
jgi:uncharacterized protein (UPF0297 family)